MGGSGKMASSLVGSAEEIPAAQLSALDKAEQLTYESVTNFARAAKGCAQMCVMCGNGRSVVIPRQNKDVCRECDKAIWRHASTGAYFKWCKGCKNFLQIGNFSQKLEAAKCDKCRERGRTSYLLKKRYAERPAKDEPDSSAAAAISLVALAKTDDSTNVISSQFGCALSSTLHSESEDEDPTDVVLPREGTSGLLFELAAIHSTILKLEQRAELVGPLEEKVERLRVDLDAALKREAEATAELATLKRELEDDDTAAKRPRLISFDAASNASGDAHPSERTLMP